MYVELYKICSRKCNNYHGTICQHANYNERAVEWYPDFKTNLDGVLEKTALTAEFGYKENDFVLRSKYKQTFGLCYCPKGYRMIRSNNNKNLAWATKPANLRGKEVYEYDYMESYWMVDKDLYEKDIDSICTTSQPGKDQRVFKDVRCYHWHFYLCEKLGRRPTKPLSVTIDRAPPSEWKEGEQPRKYPLTKADPDNCGNFHNNTCKCIERSALCGYNTVTNQCVPRLSSCPKNMFEKKWCQRKGDHIYYAVQGLVCNSQQHNSMCNIEKQVYAGNMGGKQHEDIRNISYLAGGNALIGWELPNGNLYLQGASRYKDIIGIPSKDTDLYSNWFSGMYQNLGRSRSQIIRNTCPKLHFAIDGDGLYEISIKTGELWWLGENGHRTFSLILNDLFIVRELEIESYRARGYGFELVANFRVFQGGTMMELQGHPSKKIVREDKKVTFEACFSFCHNEIMNYKVDRNWVIYALSVIKYSG